MNNCPFTLFKKTAKILKSVQKLERLGSSDLHIFPDCMITGGKFKKQSSSVIYQNFKNLYHVLCIINNINECQQNKKALFKKIQRNISDSINITVRSECTISGTHLIRIPLKILSTSGIRAMSFFNRLDVGFYKMSYDCIIII